MEAKGVIHLEIKATGYTDTSVRHRLCMITIQVKNSELPDSHF